MSAYLQKQNYVLRLEEALQAMYQLTQDAPPRLGRPTMDKGLDDLELRLSSLMSQIEYELDDSRYLWDASFNREASNG